MIQARWRVLVALAAPITAPAQRLELPTRPADALPGSTLAEHVTGLSLAAREEVLRAEVLRGNVPDFLRTMVPVTMRHMAAGGEIVVRFWATSDYLAVGSDRDHFRVPLSPETAQLLADATGTSLPTSLMVNAIWHAAEVRLGPDSIAPSAAMITVPVFVAHDRMVQARRAAVAVPLGTLVAGHKKDVVLSRRLDSLPGRVAIYGWHTLDSVPIQPLNTWHTTGHVDYSHGIRLVSRRIEINGTPHDLLTVLRDTALATAISAEGVMRFGRYPTTIPVHRPE